MPRSTRNSKKIITLCSSAAFFRDLFPIEKELNRLGFKAVLPISALEMRRKGDFEVSHNKIWFKNPADYKKKTYLMKNHFRKVVAGDAILVVNLEKHGEPGYIGGNTLGEMVLAFHFKKPIFLWNAVDSKSPLYEEVVGLGAKVVDQDLTKIKL